MSLEALRSVRRAGKRPESVVVVIGLVDLDDHEGIVQIPGEPSEYDLRPLIGLPVHVIDAQDDQQRARRVIEALEAVSVRPLGICGPAGACGVSAEHERAMQSYRRALCQS